MKKVKVQKKIKVAAIDIPIYKQGENTLFLAKDISEIVYGNKEPWNVSRIAAFAGEENKISLQLRGCRKYCFISLQGLRNVIAKFPKKSNVRLYLEQLLPSSTAFVNVSKPNLDRGGVSYFLSQKYQAIMDQLCSLVLSWEDKPVASIPWKDVAKAVELARLKQAVDEIYQ